MSHSITPIKKFFLIFPKKKGGVTRGIRTTSCWKLARGNLLLFHWGLGGIVASIIETILENRRKGGRRPLQAVGSFSRPCDAQIP